MLEAGGVRIQKIKIRPLPEMN